MEGDHPYWKFNDSIEYIFWSQEHYMTKKDDSIKQKVEEILMLIFNRDIDISFVDNDDFHVNNNYFKIESSDIPVNDIVFIEYADNWIVMKIPVGASGNDFYLCDDWWGFERLMRDKYLNKKVLELFEEDKPYWPFTDWNQEKEWFMNHNTIDNNDSFINRIKEVLVSVGFSYSEMSIYEEEKEFVLLKISG